MLRRLCLCSWALVLEAWVEELTGCFRTREALIEVCSDFPEDTKDCSLHREASQRNLLRGKMSEPGLRRWAGVSQDEERRGYFFGREIMPSAIDLSFLFLEYGYLHHCYFVLLNSLLGLHHFSGFLYATFLDFLKKLFCLIKFRIIFTFKKISVGILIGILLNV